MVFIDGESFAIRGRAAAEHHSLTLPEGWQAKWQATPRNRRGQATRRSRLRLEEMAGKRWDAKRRCDASGFFAGGLYL
jgi:hypothetical protein